MKHGRISKLAMEYEEAKMLEKHHRAKSRTQYHPGSLKRLEKTKRQLKQAVSRL